LSIHPSSILENSLDTQSRTKDDDEDETLRFSAGPDRLPNYPLQQKKCSSIGSPLVSNGKSPLSCSDDPRQSSCGLSSIPIAAERLVKEHLLCHMDRVSALPGLCRACSRFHWKQEQNKPDDWQKGANKPDKRLEGKAWAQLFGLRAYAQTS
jgi:hypothetical protein